MKTANPELEQGLMPPQAPSPGVRQGNGLELWKAGTAAATIGATVVANVALELPKTVEVGKVEVGDESATPLIRPQFQGRGTAGEKLKPGSKVTINPTLEVPQEKWAKDFAKDAEAGKVTGQKELNKVIDAVEDLKTDGYKIKKIIFTGHASAEDDSTNENGVRTAGLQKKSEKNTELAEKRATELEKQVGPELDEIEGLPDVSFGVPFEDILTNKEVARIEGLAGRFGYDSITTMIEQYNRDESVPSTVKRYLDRVLARERKVEVRIVAEKEDSQINSESDGIFVPGVEIDGDSATDVEEKIPIKVPLFVIVPVPLFRRRKQERNDSVMRYGRKVPRIGSGGKVEFSVVERPGLGYQSKAETNGHGAERVSQISGSVIRPRSQKQPREHNFSKNNQKVNGRQGRTNRSKGGDRGQGGPRRS